MARSSTTFKKGHRGYWKGKTLPKAAKEKMSLVRKGKQMGPDNHGWKGRKAKNVAKHVRMYRRCGQPRKCDHCGSTKKKAYDWANISGKHLLRRSDWLRLCRGCHLRFDRNR